MELVESDNGKRHVLVRVEGETDDKWKTYETLCGRRLFYGSKVKVREGVDPASLVQCQRCNKYVRRLNDGDKSTSGTQSGHDQVVRPDGPAGPDPGDHEGQGGQNKTPTRPRTNPRNGVGQIRTLDSGDRGSDRRRSPDDRGTERSRRLEASQAITRHDEVEILGGIYEGRRAYVSGIFSVAGDRFARLQLNRVLAAEKLTITEVPLFLLRRVK